MFDSSRLSEESDPPKSVRFPRKSLIPAPESLAVYVNDCPGQAAAKAPTKRVIAFFCAVEPLAVKAGLPPQLTFIGAALVFGLLPVGLLCPPRADSKTAIRTVRARPNALLACVIGVDGARATAVFRAGMRHVNKIARRALAASKRRLTSSATVIQPSLVPKVDGEQRRLTDAGLKVTQVTPTAKIDQIA